jgi:hypothetical protein
MREALAPKRGLNVRAECTLYGSGFTRAVIASGGHSLKGRVFQMAFKLPDPPLGIDALKRLFYSIVAVAIVCVLAVVRCFFLTKSDTGIQWEVMARVLAIGTWFSRQQRTRSISVARSAVRAWHGEL